MNNFQRSYNKNLEPLPPAFWPWQHSLKTRIVLAYAVMFAIVLAALTWWVSQIIFDNQIEQSEHVLEIEAFLISNALEDSLSGFASEFDQYLRFLHKNTDSAYLTGNWRVDGFSFTVNGDTFIEERFGSLTIGGCAAITYRQQDGAGQQGKATSDQNNYLATNVESITCNTKSQIHSEPIEIYTRVDLLPADHPSGFWQIGGVFYKADSTSRIDREIRVGQCVELYYSGLESPYKISKLETADECPTSLQHSGIIEALPQSDSPTVLDEAAKEQGIPTMPRLEQFVSQQALDSGTNVTIMDIWGNVIADSHYPSKVFENQFEQVEVQAALEGTEQHDIRTNPLTNELAIYVAVPIQQSNRRLGLVRLTQTMEDVVAPARNLLLGLLLSSFLALFITICVGYFLGQRLVAPLQRLEYVALAIAKGDLEQQVALDRSDELGSLARTFNYMVRELKYIFEQQRLFIANASHELRTPLTNIRLRSDVLLHIESEPETTALYIKDINNETLRLEQLANELLDITRLENKVSQINSAKGLIPKIDIHEHLTKLYGTMKLRAQSSNAKLTYKHPQKAILPFAILPYDLDTIVINLLNNAIKYIPTDGEIELILDITISEQGAKIIQIAVRDTGIGISEDELSKIFDRFYRVDQARTRSQVSLPMSSGAGLGLSLVKATVDKYHGDISVQSVVNQGSLFTVEFALE